MAEISETRLYVATMEDGSVVSLDTERSHALTHLQDQPKLWDLTQDALSKSRARTRPGNDAFFETDMGEIIGETDLAEIEPSDWEGPKEKRIRWARRAGRHLLTPFVVRDRGEETSFITVGLRYLDIRKIDPGMLNPELRADDMAQRRHHDLVTTFLGRTAPPLPGSPFETPDSVSFWQEHAIRLGTQQIVPGSVTFENPWPQNITENDTITL